MRLDPGQCEIALRSVDQVGRVIQVLLSGRRGRRHALVEVSGDDMNTRMAELRGTPQIFCRRRPGEVGRGAQLVMLPGIELWPVPSYRIEIDIELQKYVPVPPNIRLRDLAGTTTVARGEPKGS